MASLVYTESFATDRVPAWAILRKSLRDRLRSTRPRWASKRVLVDSALYCLLGFAYALAVAFDLPVPRLRIEHDPSLAIGLDLLLLASFNVQFRWLQRPRELNLRVPYCPGCRRCTSRALARALLQAGGTVAVVFGLWQPLPQLMWHVASPIAATLLWVAYGMGWSLMLWRARDPLLLVAGVCLVEWSAPGMTLGHLVFAIGMSAFAVHNRKALALLARGDDPRLIYSSQSQHRYAQT